jgi:flagellar basal-body rod protein FlgB
MRPDDVPVLALLRQSIGFHSDRQSLITENVANANTPGYVPQDLNESDFHRAVAQDMQARRSSGGLRMNRTEALHLEGPSNSSRTRVWSAEDRPDSETTVNGNAVVVEEQLVRAQENRLRYESALSLYQKSLSLLRMAARSPGG